MNDEIKQRRRQAAWFCFEPYLSEDNLIQAIELLEDRFQFEGMATLISYMTTVCSQFDIHKDIGKELSIKFFELMAYKRTELPEDPLPLIAKRRVNSQRSQKQPIVEERIVEENKFNVKPLEAETTSSIANAPPHSVIFICFIQQIIKEAFVDNAALIRLITRFSEQDKRMERELKAIIANWGKNLQNFQWATTVSPTYLAKLTHLVYLCLCEVAGPVEADQIFHKVIAVCEQEPEAKLFSPTQLL